jgi:hypothetical protein
MLQDTSRPSEGSSTLVAVAVAVFVIVAVREGVTDGVDVAVAV